MYDGKIITILILSFVTTILLSILISDFIIGKEVEVIHENMEQALVKLSESNDNITKEYQDSIIKLAESFNGSSDTIIVSEPQDDSMTSEDFSLLINSVLETTIRYNEEYRKELNDIYTEAIRSNRRTRIVYVPTGGVS